MGGFNSGNRRPRSAKKTTVEDCLPLDANRWTREGILQAGIRDGGCWPLCDWRGADVTIHYATNTLASSCGYVALWYTRLEGSTGRIRSMHYLVRLTTTRSPAGGVRWWFLCPVAKNGKLCYRRVAKLYLPPDDSYFGCRHCHKLTYQSCQESRKPAGIHRIVAQSQASICAKSHDLPAAIERD
jgi:hypothetical protein